MSEDFPIRVDQRGSIVIWTIERADRANALSRATLFAFGKLARGTFDPIRAAIGMQVSGEDSVWWGPDEVGRDIAETFLNGRIYSIAGGTNEMQRNAISERIYRLPRERSAP